jgi:hypothetical protein
MEYNDFSYWFSDTIVDPKGNTVSDINKGLTRLIPDLIDQLNDLNNDHTRFIPTSNQDGQPDLIAFNNYGTDSLWWYVCLSSCIEDPFNDISHKMVLYTYDKKYLTNHAEKEITESQDNMESKIGKIIELN